MVAPVSCRLFIWVKPFHFLNIPHSYQTTLSHDGPDADLACSPSPSSPPAAPPS